MAETVEIALTKGYVAIIDADDADLARMKWLAQVDPTGTVYAVSTSACKDVNTRLMHRIILQRVLGRRMSRDEKTDHRDGQGLNNTRENLRLATNTQNIRNQKVSKKSLSGVKGVTWDKKSRKWYAQIRVNGRSIYLGLFADLNKAIIVRHQAEVHFFGEFAPSLSRSRPTQEVTQTPAPLPVIECVACGEPMTAIWQPGLLPSQDGMFLVTCENPNCRMYGFTLADKNYPPDLALYLVPKVEYAS